MSTGKLSKMLFSKVLPLSLHALLAPVLPVQEGTKAEGLLPRGMFLGCQSPRPRLQTCLARRLLLRLGPRAAAGDGTPVRPPVPSEAPHGLHCHQSSQQAPGPAPGCPWAGGSQPRSPCPGGGRATQQPNTIRGDSGTLLAGLI